MRSLGRLSLQSKLFLSIVVVIALASVIGYLFINYTVREAFSSFTVRSFTMQDRILLQLIVAYYNRTGSFDGLVEFLEQSAREVPVLLVDPGGEVVYPTNVELPQRGLSEDVLRRGQAIVLPNGETWTLVPYRTNPELEILEARFLQKTRRSLWLAGFAAGAAGLLISFLLLRQVTRPLKRLDSATRRIARGEFGEPVEIRTDDEIGRLSRSFNEMAESLERAERTKKQMIADVSHELRTPLAAVRSVLEALRDGLIEPTPETLASLHDKILLTTRLVHDLHQLTLADAGRLSIRPVPCRIEEIVDTIVETIGVQLEDSSVRLERRIPVDIPAIVVDRQRIEQVFLNLLANAIRHTPDGGSISISAVERPEGVEVGICDSGPGLTETDLAHVFDRFYRADDARTGDGGAGLGLSIAKALVDAHGGHVWAENGPSGGACFHVVLPKA